MDSIRIRTPAKINLFLRVLGKRPDGYHDLETLFQAIDLTDELVISKTRGELSLEVPGHPDLETEDNLVLRAVRWIEGETGERIWARIRLSKHIPTAGGLGGGSSDAAAVLIGIRELFGLRLDDQSLERGALSLGADVPFFLMGGTAVGEGVGEKLTPVNTEHDYGLVLVNPGFSVSTASVFRELDRSLTAETRQSKLWGLLSAGVGPERLLENDLQPVTESLYPRVRQARELLSEAGFSQTLMSGSGPTVFAIADAGGQEIGRVTGRLPSNWEALFIRPVNRGVIMD
ncbi:4-(cytidine 5'-diphospho)-2-C-methyl-D-erythritol kinase [Thermodesulfobacteriota bacterium]